MAFGILRPEHGPPSPRRGMPPPQIDKFDNRNYNHRLFVSTEDSKNADINKPIEVKNGQRKEKSMPGSPGISNAVLGHFF